MQAQPFSTPCSGLGPFIPSVSAVARRIFKCLARSFGLAGSLLVLAFFLFPSAMVRFVHELDRATGCPDLSNLCLNTAWCAVRLFQREINFGIGGLSAADGPGTGGLSLPWRAQYKLKFWLWQAN